MSDALCGRVTLALTYHGDVGRFDDLQATKLTTHHSGTASVTFVLDNFPSPLATFLVGIPAVAETSGGERWNVWFRDAGLTLATAGRAAR